MVEDGVTGYVVDPATPEGFALAIARAIGLPEKERSALALRRFDTARERFAIDGVAERLLELFERLRVAA